MKYWFIALGEDGVRDANWLNWKVNKIVAIHYGIKSDMTGFSAEQIKDSMMLADTGGELGPKAPEFCDKFINQINIGDMVIVKRGVKEIQGIGRVTSDYYFDESERSGSCSKRDIEWISTENNKNLDKNFPQDAVYELKSFNVRPYLLDYIDNLLKEFNADTVDVNDPGGMDYTAHRNNQLAGYVYVLGLSAYPGKYKVGHANNVIERVKSLQTSVPETFTIWYEKEFQDSAKAEKTAHVLLKGSRIQGEWFQQPLTEIKDKINSIEQ